MQITVTHGTGTGKTELSAFDKALHDAGIANYNIITLSSIIPPDTEVIPEMPDINKDEYGHKLYAILNRKTGTEKGDDACAGLGWMQDKTGKGLFVEHSSSSEEEVREIIAATFDSMRSYRPELEGEIDYMTAKIRCEKDPVCAIVCAVYKTEKW
ncbi:MAG: pyruvoyl-dependent arginine decarboxylase [archaeon]|nr:pyruvoyl-dependent arginine decarboxylase [archaeon]